MENNQVRQFRIRVIERSGKTIKATIGTRYPRTYCISNKIDCFLCSTSTKNFKSDTMNGLHHNMYCML